MCKCSSSIRRSVTARDVNNMAWIRLLCHVKGSTRRARLSAIKPPSLFHPIQRTFTKLLIAAGRTDASGGNVRSLGQRRSKVLSSSHPSPSMWLRLLRHAMQKLQHNGKTGVFQDGKMTIKTSIKGGERQECSSW